MWGRLSTDRLWRECHTGGGLVKVLRMQTVSMQASLAPWVLRLDHMAFANRGLGLSLPAGEPSCCMKLEKTTPKRCFGPSLLSLAFPEELQAQDPRTLPVQPEQEQCRPGGLCRQAERSSTA